MRRLVIFCDGTWNKETTETPTNVVRAAQAVRPIASDGTQQIVFYVQGVGSTFMISKIESILAGAFGLGLFDRIADAYRFLVFNYLPGDEIYIFGFSRGAFTARSLGGLVRKCGIIPKASIREIGKAYDFYRTEDKPDSDPAVLFRALNSPNTIMKDDPDRLYRQKHGLPIPDVPNFTVKYLGVWDTVGELGVPKYLLLRGLVNQKYRFHDMLLSSTVEAARQALAVDENRIEFEPTPWENLSILNQTPGRQGNYQQHWFPGDHGSVGGGGEILGLSHASLGWIMEGAVAQGLELNDGALDEWRKEVDFRADLHNSKKPLGFADRFLYRHGPRTGPDEPYGTISDTTRERLLYGKKVQGWAPYRPESLKTLIDDYPHVIGEEP